MELKKLDLSNLILRNLIFQRRDIYCILKEFLKSFKNNGNLINDNYDNIIKELERLDNNIKTVVEGEGDYLLSVPDNSLDINHFTQRFKDWLDKCLVTDFWLETPDDPRNKEKIWKLVLQRNNIFDNGYAGVTLCDLTPLIEYLSGTGVALQDWFIEPGPKSIYVYCKTSEGNDALMFKLPLVDKLEGNAGLMSPEDKKKLDSIKVDTDNNLLIVNGKAYKLIPNDEEEITIIGYEYGTPKILGFGYNIVPTIGGKVSPLLKVTQKYVVNYSNGTSEEKEHIVEDIETAKDLGFVFNFSANFGYNKNYLDSTNGSVNIPGSDSEYQQKVYSVKMTVYNSNDIDEKSAYSNADIYRSPYIFNIDETVNTNNINAEGDTIVIPILEKSEGVEITSIRSLNINIASAVLNESGDSIIITVKPNYDTDQVRNCIIRIVTTCGTRDIEVTQLASELSYDIIWEKPVITSFAYPIAINNGETIVPNIINGYQKQYKVFSNGTKEEIVEETFNLGILSEDNAVLEFKLNEGFVHHNNFISVSDYNGAVTVKANGTNTNDIVKIDVRVKWKGDQYSDYASTIVKQQSGEFSLNTDNASELTGNGDTLNILITKRTAGVDILGINTSDESVATASLDNNIIHIFVSENNTSDIRTCVITVTSTAGVKTVRVTQSAKTTEPDPIDPIDPDDNKKYAYVGSTSYSDGISKELGTPIELSSDETRAEITITRYDEHKIIYAMLPDGYTAEIYDFDDYPITNSDQLVVDDLNVYYAGKDNWGIHSPGKYYIIITKE